MRTETRGAIRAADGSLTKASKLKKNIGVAPYFSPISNRLKAVWLTQYLLRAQRDLYKGLDSFEPLVESINQFLREVDACEGQFLLAAWGKIDLLALETHVDEFVENLGEAVSEPNFHSVEDNSDVERYAERAWEGIARLSPWLQDAVRGAHDSGPPDLWRFSEFERAYEKLTATGQSEKPSAISAISTQPITFRGEAWVRDDAFVCQVERLIVNGLRASIQMSCNDDGGPHSADGVFVLQDGAWQTRTFSVRYLGDSVDTPARFHLGVLEIAGDRQNARMEAEWDQGGETFLLDADLDRI